MDDQVHLEMMERNLRPRLCYLTKGDRGYGFHLHGERRHGAQVIRKIEAGSPAELAGLRSGDRVVEVNGENVEKDSHQQVVQKITEVDSRTRLLVVDQETDDFLRRNSLPCTEDLAVEMSCFLLPRGPRPGPRPRLSPRARAPPPVARCAIRSLCRCAARPSGHSTDPRRPRCGPSLWSRVTPTLRRCASRPISPQESISWSSCDSNPPLRPLKYCPESCDSNLPSPRKSAPRSPQESITLASCDSNPRSPQEYCPSSCDSNLPSPRNSAPPSPQEFITLASSDSNPRSPQEFIPPSRPQKSFPSSSGDSNPSSPCKSAPYSPQESIPLASCDSNPRSSQKSIAPSRTQEYCPSSCDSNLTSPRKSAPYSPQESIPPSPPQKSFPSSSGDSNPWSPCKPACPSPQESIPRSSCDPNPPSPCKSTRPSSQESVPPSPPQNPFPLSSGDSNPWSPGKSTSPSSQESVPSSPPQIISSFPSSPGDSNPPSPQESVPPSRPQKYCPSPCDSNPPSPRESTPSPPYDIITFPSGGSKSYGTPTRPRATIVTNGNQEMPGSEDAAWTRDLRPRLCQVVPDEQGFGFNLHCDKRHEGQYIRSVDPDSPAQRAGLLAGDRLIQVNDRRIKGMRHSEVVALIRGCGQETKLLVVDPETDALFQKLEITPTTAHLKEDCVDGPIIDSPASNLTPTDPPVSNGSPKHWNYGSSSSRSTLSETSVDLGSPDTTADPKIQDLKQVKEQDPLWDDGLHLSHTAAEARQKVRSKKARKAAPPMTWRKKHEVFSNF
ncbi:LOW QUALITY PROTEIN: nascent polypeptide-associated complex subunit alpha, muscle-specific form [Trichomycterus rosablanca]|uniref:LOW QUALITY PROTEIN: nascent polypeptide-associated complex subunit alpha, muscle-specific form n=1 Tax=Trichomycterus rosablanca TaxID=2290929 RepID=UPI002F3572D0